jgi:hypothetical protein
LCAQFEAAPSGKNTVFNLSGKISLDSLTRYVHATSGLRLAFNSSQVIGNRQIDFPKRKYSLEELLQHLRKSTNLQVRQYHGYIVLSDKLVVTKKAAPVPDKHLRVMAVSQVPATINLVHYSVQPARPLTVDKSILRGLPKKKADTVQAIAQQPITNKGSSSWSFHAGLQWDLPVPIYGTRDYFTGTNGQQNGYTLLVPGVWGSAILKERHELLLQVGFFSQYYGANHVLTDSAGTGTPGDSLLRFTTQLVKTGGLAAGLQYQYHLGVRWVLGAGIEYHVQSAALLRQKTIVKSSGGVISDESIGVKQSDSLAQNLPASFWAGRLEVGYNIQQWRVGIALQAPLSGIYHTASGALQPLNLQLFVRWRLY